MKNGKWTNLPQGIDTFGSGGRLELRTLGL